MEAWKLKRILENVSEGVEIKIRVPDRRNMGDIREVELQMVPENEVTGHTPTLILHYQNHVDEVPF